MEELSSISFPVFKYVGRDNVHVRRRRMDGGAGERERKIEIRKGLMMGCWLGLGGWTIQPAASLSLSSSNF